MLKKRLLVIMLFFGFTVFAQLKGKVTDENNNPIPYVNIAVENENNGTSSEENGEFSINLLNENKNLIFTALGFEKKTIKASETSKVVLKPTEYQLSEVIIAKKFGSKQEEIGETDNKICQSFDNGPRIDIKFFPYLESYKRTKYIKQVKIYTDSRIEKATIKIHFYKVDPNGFPGDEFLKKDFVVTVKKGTTNNIYDLAELSMKMPKNGIFVGFEKLIIEKNKVEKTTIDLITNKPKTQKTYYPFCMYNHVERESLFTFSGGKWNKQTKENSNGSSNKIMVFEPAINLILSN